MSLRGFDLTKYLRRLGICDEADAFFMQISSSEVILQPRINRKMPKITITSGPTIKETKGYNEMVHARLHIICGNCGQDLKEPDMATWEYIPAEIDEEDGEIFDPADVHISCKNCATLHSLGNYITERVRKEDD